MTSIKDALTQAQTAIDAVSAYGRVGTRDAEQATPQPAAQPTAEIFRHRTLQDGFTRINTTVKLLVDADTFPLGYTKLYTTLQPAPSLTDADITGEHEHKYSHFGTEQARRRCIHCNELEPAPKRPPNCGTGHCSCIECHFVPAPTPTAESLRPEFEAWAGPMGFHLGRSLGHKVAPEPWCEYLSTSTGYLWAGYIGARGAE